MQTMGRLRGGALQQSLRRLSTGPRGTAEEKTPPPVAAEVIYKNPEAVANRLRLFHLMRLQVQARLDLPHLQGMCERGGDAALVGERLAPPPRLVPL